MNYLWIAGHLGSDPEVRYTSGGQKVTSFRVAVNQRKSGKEETMWWRVTVWGEQFDRMMPYLKKGSAVIVLGEMSKPEIYNGRDGAPQISLNMTAHNISFSPFGKGDREGQGGMGASAGMPQAPAMGAPTPSAPTHDQGGAQGSDFGFGGGDYAGMQQGQGGASPMSGGFSDDEIPF